MFIDWRRALWVGCVLAGSVGPVRAEMLVVESRSVERLAEIQGTVRLVGVLDAETGEAASLDLERFEVFAPDARITVHGPMGDQVMAPPENLYFKGVVAGRPDDSRVFLALLPRGRVQAVVVLGGENYLVGGDEGPGEPLEMQRADLRRASSGSQGFQCDNQLLPPGRSTLDGLAGLDLTAPPEPAEPSSGANAAVAPVSYTARVAIETDYELYAKFNDPAAATTYIANLIGYASTLYASEISTSLAIQSVSLWSTSSDPWGQSDGLCSLMEFGRYWNRNRTGVPRTIAHFLSGRPTGGGVAWIGVLCSGAFGASGNCPGLATDAPWGGGYGFTGNMTGTFNASNPTVMWDILAVSHEIGHNFNSPHTHCYAGIDGNANPVDSCYSGEGGCYAGPQSLPGPAGVRSGTLMSYCHLLPGGYSNVALTFGTSHPYGIAPGRVPTRMSTHVAAKAALNPSCLAPVSQGSAIFADGLESGTVPGAWSGDRSGI